jgi:hypothetical protein
MIVCIFFINTGQKKTHRYAARLFLLEGLVIRLMPNDRPGGSQRPPF